MRSLAAKVSLLALLIAALAGLASASLVSAAPGRPHVAAMQAALWDRGHYRGAVDGLDGPLTRAALASFQSEVGLKATGRAGARTVAALGGPQRGLHGAVVVRQGDTGWNVVRLQFLLAWRGFPSGAFDGLFGERVAKATQRFQRRAGLEADGIAGPSTFKALRKPLSRSRARLSMPLQAPLTDAFGPRMNRFHAGIDLPAQAGAPVSAVKAGTVVFAGYSPGGFGNLVVVRHRYGLTTRYAHLSEALVRDGQQVRRGETLGLVGSTGRSSGPHLHLEVTFLGAYVDPVPLLRG